MGRAVRACSTVVRAGMRPGGPEGLEELDSGKGFRALDLESNAVGSLLLLADNYNHTTNDFTTETQSAQRTHRDF